MHQQHHLQYNYANLHELAWESQGQEGYCNGVPEWGACAGGNAYAYAAGAPPGYAGPGSADATAVAYEPCTYSGGVYGEADAYDGYDGYTGYTSCAYDAGYSYDAGTFAAALDSGGYGAYASGGYEVLDNAVAVGGATHSQDYPMPPGHAVWGEENHGEDQDEQAEVHFHCAIGMRLQEGRWSQAWEQFLQMRELWRGASSRFLNRGLTFNQFNQRYRESFKALRDAAEQLSPAMACRLPVRRWVTMRALDEGPIDAAPLVGKGHCFKNGFLASVRALVAEAGLAGPGVKVAPVPPKGCIRVMTFNLLSEALNDQFSYQFVTLLEGRGDFLRWEVRQRLILAEIQRWSPGVVCLQEVDLALHKSLRSKLHKLGYECTAIVRRNGHARDGLCFAYDPKLLELVGKSTTSIISTLGAARGAARPQESSVCSIVLAVPQESRRRVAVVTAHVAGMEPACTAEAMDTLTNHAATLDCDCVVMAGDFNGCLPEAFERADAAGFRSAYHAAGDLAMEAGGAIVTAHNDEYHNSGELDFIWYTCASITPRGVAQIQREERLVTERRASHPRESLPNPHWPSDHISLVADLELLPPRSFEAVPAADAALGAEEGALEAKAAEAAPRQEQAAGGPHTTNGRGGGVPADAG